MHTTPSAHDCWLAPTGPFEHVLEPQTRKGPARLFIVVMVLILALATVAMSFAGAR